MDRIDLYLMQSVNETYTNTPEEEELLNKFTTLFALADSAKQQHWEVNDKNLDMWRRAYLGTLNAINTVTGEESKKKSRQLKKICQEMIESKVDNSIPMPKMMPRHKSDKFLVDVTESYLKYSMDTILSKQENDKSERSTLIDGTTWYKVSWDSLDRTATRSGSPKVDICLADQIIPQPGVLRYEDLEYIFEIRDISITRIYDLYGRLMTPTSNNTNVIPVVSCYYLNANREVGLFMWAKDSRQVICHEDSWQIRKLRTCTKCHTVVPIADTCPVCGSKHMRFEDARTEILDRDLMEVYNPYEAGESDDKANDRMESRVFLSRGTEIPQYIVRQLPFVPRPAVSSINSIYGISEVFTLLDMQDAVNKILTKATDKTLKAGAVLTKPEKLKLNDKDETLKVLGVRTQEEAAMVQCKQVMSDTTQDMTMVSLLYDSARSSSGVTDSFQGKKDTTATSGKAKEYATVQTAGRIESLRVMKAATFAGLYELLLKYLLAFSDEPVSFVRTLPDGTQEELEWNKYMFLDKDKNGQIYYKDDFEFSTDPAATLTQNRVQMWQETQDKFINGALGNPADARTLELYWNIMDSFQYPLAKVVLAGIRENSQHLPQELEQALLNNPEAMQAAMAVIEQGTEQRGGARANSGPAGNGATHAANVERTNDRNRAANKQPVVPSQQGGGL